MFPSRSDTSRYSVASGIFQINTGVSTFQRLVNTLDTPKDTPELRYKTRLHIGQLVIQLCPFCKTSNYAVEYRGGKTKEEKSVDCYGRQNKD
ncbi:unnamed protein product [Thlaspi arvense]|uniref:Syntaxin N-terminal domain-containing protein n=1 Tax=Thlaspi arvense TaxID=13288 RepID=A0AAU9SA82_THLAR|nr:unnamed protein product [Thlaspi arvense]